MKKNKPAGERRLLSKKDANRLWKAICAKGTSFEVLVSGLCLATGRVARYSLMDALMRVAKRHALLRGELDDLERETSALRAKNRRLKRAMKV